MRKLKLTMVLMLAVAAVGCVTINVYFPAAAAEKAAQKFIGNVIGDDAAPASSSSSPAPAQPDASSGGMGAALLDLVVPAAHAAGQDADIKISTPAIEALRASMRARFNKSLKPLLDSGAIGFTSNGMVALRDAGSVPLSQRNQVRQLIDSENRDRNDVYKKIAAANGHPEWEEKIRKTFAGEWLKQAHAGWYYQDSAGNWKQK
ncbi:MAG: YdbL family protein [Rhodanobacteraceae bacterium]